jgi:hypothetical protein
MRMHRLENFKITEAQQANLINNWKNAKHKLLQTRAAIWFHKICRNRQQTPRNVNIKIKDNNQRNKST